MIRWVLASREAWFVTGWRRWVGWLLLLAAIALGWATADVVATLVSVTLGVAGFGLIDAHERLADAEIRLVRVRVFGRLYPTVMVRGVRLR